jgi:L-lactate dehydrogenase (FMN-dependent) and related alpha-hydroxy acid dehydrogenases
MTTYYKGFPQSTREEKLHMVNLDELEHEAKYVMPEAAYYYVASGAENEWTWRNNTQAFNHFQIVPRALTGMQNPELNTEFLGMKLKSPVMIFVQLHATVLQTLKQKLIRQKAQKLLGPIWDEYLCK